MIQGAHQISVALENRRCDEVRLHDADINACIPRSRVPGAWSHAVPFRVLRFQSDPEIRGPDEAIGICRVDHCRKGAAVSGYRLITRGTLRLWSELSRFAISVLHQMIEKNN